MEKRSFRFAKFAVAGITWSTGGLVVAGVLSLFTSVIPGAAPYLTVACILSFAGMAGFALCVAQAAAACAQVLQGDKVKAARWVAYACAGITGGVSIAGVWLADAILSGEHPSMPPRETMLAAGFALAFIKPAMAFVIAACEGAERQATNALDGLVEQQRAQIADLKRQLAAAEKPSQDNAPKPARATAGAARRLAHELAHQRPIGPSRRSEPTPAEDVAPEPPRDVSIAEIEAACQEIIQRRDDQDRPVEPSLRLVASQLNVPRSRVEKTLTVAQTKLAIVAAKVKQAA